MLNAMKNITVLVKKNKSIDIRLEIETQVRTVDCWNVYARHDDVLINFNSKDSAKKIGEILKTRFENSEIQIIGKNMVIVDFKKEYKAG